MKKIIALVLALVMMFALCACTGGGKGTSVDFSEVSTEPLTENDTIRLVLTSAPSWPYDEDWKVWQYIRENIPAKIDVTAIPEVDVATKLPLIFADQASIPDLLHKYGAMTSYVRSGAIIPFEDVQELMPNATAYYESLSDADYENYVTLNRNSDGKLYWFVHTGREPSRDVQTWIYRKDIFDKHNLKVPTTYDELYEVCKELKKLYPDSYPYSMREGMSRFTSIGNQFKKDFRPGVYLDTETNEWHYGYTEDTMREMLEFHIKMIDEGLLMPNFTNIATNAWQELVATDRGFIMPEYQTRVDFFNSLGRMDNPDYHMAAMVPPVASEEGVPMMKKTNVERYGFSICNTRDPQRIANAAKYLDWFYTDEATELVSWGKEGETYEVVDGKKQYIRDEANTQIQTLYGFDSNGSFLRMDTEALLLSESEEIAETREEVLAHIAPSNPADRLAFTKEEAEVMSDMTISSTAYCEEMIAKFLTKQEPLSKWDEFTSTFKSLLDLETYFGYYQAAYDRIYG